MFLFRIVLSLILFLSASYVFSETEVQTETEIQNSAEMQTETESNFVLEFVGSISEIFFPSPAIEVPCARYFEPMVNTNLLEASQTLNMACISTLLEKGAEPNIQNDQGETALHIIATQIVYLKYERDLFKPVSDSASYHRPPIISMGMPITFGSPSIQKNHVVPLIQKTQNYTYKFDDPGPPYGEMVRILIEAGAEPNIQNDQGETALHVAVMQAIQAEEAGQFILGPEQVIPALLEAGADPTIPDNQGQTAFDLAKTNEVRGLLNL